jgi:hypothetical protein
MQHVWKVLFVIALLLAVYVAWERHSTNSARRVRVRQLAGMLERSDFEVKLPPAIVHGEFFKALALLHASAQPEPPGLFFSGQSKTADWYLTEALTEAGYAPEDHDRERRLLIASFQEALADCQSAGVFEDSGNIAGLQEGRSPTLMKGPFAGERWKVGFRISPVAAVEVQNHPANFKLLPATVWALQPDRLDQPAMEVARDFRDARIIQPAVMRRIDELWKSSQKNN